MSLTQTCYTRFRFGIKAEACIEKTQRPSSFDCESEIIGFRWKLISFNAGDGATPGSIAVAIQKFPAIEIEAVSGGVPFDESNNTDEGPALGSEKDAESELPEKYSNREESGLSATVTTDGENVFNFELTSK